MAGDCGEREGTEKRQQLPRGAGANEMGRRVYQTPAPGNHFRGVKAMTTMTQTAAKGKSKERRLKIGAKVNGVLSLAIQDSQGRHDAYFVREVVVDWGRGFRVDKVLPKDGQDSGYDVHLDKDLGHSCTCPGHIYHRQGKPCKHIAAVAVLVSLGT